MRSPEASLSVSGVVPGQRFDRCRATSAATASSGHLAQGGGGRLFLAEIARARGFVRRVVLKVGRDESDEGTVASPVEEARLAARGAVAEGRADVFALGVVLHEALTGLAPRRRPTTLLALAAAHEGRIPPLPADVAELQLLLDAEGRAFARPEGEARLDGAMAG